MMMIQSNKISLTLQSTDALKSIGVAVPCAKDGKISQFDLGATMEGPVQKEAGNTTGIYTEAKAEQLNIEGVELSEESQMSPSDFISQCTTGEDAKALSDEGTPLEEYTSSQLERAIDRIKEQRRDNADYVEHQVEKEKEEMDKIEESAMSEVAGTKVSSEILLQMQQSGLPITPENVMRISHAIDMTAEIGSLSEASMKFFVDQNLPLTPENISGSLYSSQTSAWEKKNTDENAFMEMLDQIKELLTQNGAEPDEETIKTAKWLYENNLPVTLENVKLCDRIEQLKKTDPKVLCARIIDSMTDGVNPEKANLLKLSVVEAITIKRRLEETRLFMSVDAVRMMSAKGIEFDISNLEKVVEELRVQEQQAREALLEETGLPKTENNAQIMGDTIQAAKQVLAAPISFLAKAMVEPDADTLQRLAQKATHYTEEFVKAEQRYEAVGTEVRRDLGDSMNKAFQNVDDILTDLNLEHTAQNQRAIRSLAYNQMPLTQDNVLQMKEYDSRITSLMKDMKPPVVAELIRRNVNPLEVSLEELSAEVAAIQDEYSYEDISFSKFIWKLDHQKAITPEERETMIGVYRLLDKIEKSDGAVIGQLLKEGRELSLNSLLSVVRTRRDAGMDVTVDDRFGEIEKIITNGTTISEQIQSAYNKNIIKELQKSLSPEVLREYEAQDLSLEMLLELCQQKDGEEFEYYKQMLESWQETLSGGQERLQQFLSELELPHTMANLRLAQHFLKPKEDEPQLPWNEEDSEEILEAFHEPEQLQEVYEKVSKKQEEALEKMQQQDDIVYDQIKEIAMMNRQISFYGKLRNYQMYEVPVFTEQGVTNCKVTIQSSSPQEKGTVEISMESPEFGSLQASFKLNGKRIKGFVTTSDKEKISLCQSRMDQFEKDLEENGFTMDSNNLVSGTRDSLHIGNRLDGAKNADLYQIAKCFIVSMSRKEDVV